MGYKSLKLLAGLGNFLVEKDRIPKNKMVTFQYPNLIRRRAQEMDDGEELRECGVSLVRLEDMKAGDRGNSLEEAEAAMEVRDLEDCLNFDLDHK